MPETTSRVRPSSRSTTGSASEPRRRRAPRPPGLLELIFQGDRLAAYDWHVPEGQIIFDAQIVPCWLHAGEARAFERLRELCIPRTKRLSARRSRTTSPPGAVV